MSHEVDKFGYPTDPILKQLERHLSLVAMYFRGALGNQERRYRFVREYQATLKELYQLGWDGYLDVDAELPYEYMPEEYTRGMDFSTINDPKFWIPASEFYKKKKG